MTYWYVTRLHMQRIVQLPPANRATVLTIINDAAAHAYKGAIPQDRWKEPYMSAEELAEEMKAGVQFYGLVQEGSVLGVAGIQHCDGVDLIRHCYVSTRFQRQGIGSALLQHLTRLTHTPEMLVGTSEAAKWAIRFYERHGFELVSREEKGRLLQRYWNIPQRQIETSVVLKRRHTM
ncbi:MAG: GNAT family N-acetyltransferase [Halobacteriota archaeon]